MALICVGQSMQEPSFFEILVCTDLWFVVCQACWVVQCFNEVQYKDPANVQLVVDSMRSMLHTDRDLPVKLEAAIALQMLLKRQTSG